LGLIERPRHQSSERIDLGDPAAISLRHLVIMSTLQISMGSLGLCGTAPRTVTCPKLSSTAASRQARLTVLPCAIAVPSGGSGASKDDGATKKVAPSKLKQLISPFSDPQANSKMLSLATGEQRQHKIAFEGSARACLLLKSICDIFNSPNAKITPILCIMQTVKPSPCPHMCSANVVLCCNPHPRHVPPRLPQRRAAS